MNPQIFKQAQERGWMEGWEYKLDAGIWYMFEDVLFAKRYYSLNDILFGTDFCEKFFTQQDMCELCGNPYFTASENKTHLELLVYRKEPERIAFLEKHILKEKSHALTVCLCQEHGNGGCDHTNNSKDACVELNKSECYCNNLAPHFHCEPSENIVRLPKDILPILYHDKMLETENIRDKFNEIIYAVNAQQKQINDLKINQGGH